MLMFSTDLEGYGAARAAIAFELEFAPGIDTFLPEKPLGLQMRIAPADPGQVAVFFPTEKEHSGLRFHVHAPFIPELSRASVKDTPLNEPLFRAIAQLSAASLYTIRDLGMLSAEFLGVLPNPQDSIPQRYQCIQEAIVSEMNDHPLTPVWQSGAKSVQEGGISERAHAPARYLLQAKAPIKNLLGSEDLGRIFGEEEVKPRWAIGATKNSSQERFLSSLAIREWDVVAFADFLYERLSDDFCYREDLGGYAEDEDIRTWFDSKPAPWHRDLYGLFQAALEDSRLDDFPDLRIVRMSDGSFLPGGDAYFPTEEVEHDELLPRVAREVCQAQKGRSGKAEEQARKFLQKIGVREVGEVEQIESILKQCYYEGSLRPDLKDLPVFVQFVEKYPNHAKLFQQAYIIRAEDGRWVPPGEVYLDTPFCETGLAAYYARLGKESTRVAIAHDFLDGRISKERFSDFAAKIGAQVRPDILRVSCTGNPQWDYLRRVPGERNMSPINMDYTVPGFPEILKTPTKACSRVIWNLLNGLPAEPNVLKAWFRRNASSGSRSADSQLVHQLRDHAWVPLSDGTWVRPAEACREMLCEGFHVDASKPWVQAVNFGQEAQARTAEEARRRAMIKDLGFEDPDDPGKLARAQKFTELPVEEQQEILDERQRRMEMLVPEATSPHPEQRSKRVAEQAADAPERQVESRSRSVALNRDAVKKEAQEYLTQQYTNPEGDMICQVCRARLPFKLADGSFYFEKVEFLDDLTRHHYQNYLALCPNHAAMFMHANGSAKTLRELVSEPGVNEVAIVLAGKARTLHFTRNHIADLRAVIKGEKAKPQGES